MYVTRDLASILILMVASQKDWLMMDWAYGYVSFSPRLAIVLPGGITIDFLKRPESHPIRFVCCERQLQEGQPWGKVLWAVVFEREDSVHPNPT